MEKQKLKTKKASKDYFNFVKRNDKVVIVRGLEIIYIGVIRR